jgi:homocysteine S-methyltransferase
VENSVEALTQFHLKRLLVFASDPRSWKSIDCVAFETIPLTREIRGIRRAMGFLQTQLDEPMESRGKPWWISSVFVNGQYPEMDHSGSLRLNVRQVVAAVLEEEQDSGAITGRNFASVPNGLGLNCTGVEYLVDLITEMELALEKVLDKGSSKPWLVLYPNGGGVYNPILQTWHTTNEVIGENAWAHRLGQIVQAKREDAMWGGIMVGGCCKTGPDEIRALSRTLSL